MNIILRIAVAVVLLFAGFAAGFPVGKSIGFNNGSEWALVQADLIAREAGVSMPVSYEEGHLRVVVKQPQGLHRQVWHRSDKYYEDREYAETGTRTLVETVKLAGRLRPTE